MAALNCNFIFPADEGFCPVGKARMGKLSGSLGLTASVSCFLGLGPFGLAPLLTSTAFELLFVCLLLCRVCVLQISWFSSVETLIL